MKTFKCDKIENSEVQNRFAPLEEGETYEIYDVVVGRNCTRCSGSVKLNFKIRFVLKGEFWIYDVNEDPVQISHTEECPENAIAALEQTGSAVRFSMITEVFPDKNIKEAEKKNELAC